MIIKINNIGVNLLGEVRVSCLFRDWSGSANNNNNVWNVNSNGNFDNNNYNNDNNNGVRPDSYVTTMYITILIEYIIKSRKQGLFHDHSMMVEIYIVDEKMV